MNARIAPDLMPLAKPIDTLSYDPENANEHDQASIESKKEILKRFGQRKPIVADDDGVVIAGNGLLTAARELGWEQVAVVTFPTPGLARAYALADNRQGELSKFDQQQVGDALRSLRDRGVTLTGLGWNQSEISAYLKAGDDWTPGGGDAGDGDGTPKAAEEAANATQASTMEFVTEADQAYFFTFMQDLRSKYPEVETPGARLVAWVGTL